MNIQEWQGLTIAQWQTLQIEDWGQVLFVDLDPMYSNVSLESLGFSQDNGFVYLPLESLGLPLSWSQLTAAQWQTMTQPQWQTLTTTQDYSDQQIFWLLILKLQAAALPAHQVKGSSNFFVVESRALVNSGSFNPNDY